MSQIAVYQTAGGGGGGTVTSISAGTSITLTPNPITTTGTVALTTTNLTTVDGTVYWDGSLLNTTATGSSGQVLTSGGIGVAPSYQSITPTLFPWTVITVDQTAVVNNGYFCNKSGTLSLALPAASNVGDTIKITNEDNATGVQITQIVGQQILLANSNTTSGVTGTLTSSQIGDSITVVCKTANFIWRVTEVIGNWSIV